MIVTSGLRFDAVRSRVQKHYVDRYSGDTIRNPETAERPSPLRAHREALSGRIGAVYTPVKPFTVYAGYTTSFKPVFVSPSDPETNDFDPERGQQVEVGVRTRLDIRDHVVDFDGALYWIEKRNMLVPRGMDDYSQAGKARSQGIDLQLHYSAPQFVSFSAGYSLTDPTYRNFINPNPVTGENESLKGKQLAFAPRHTGTVWLGIRFTEQLGVGFGGRFMAKQYGDPENRLPMPDYALFDTSAWFKTGRASFIFSVRNLFDERDYYLSAINQWAENPQVTPGPGREVLGTLRLEL